MDFKNYVRMMLEADKAKDQDEERAEDENEDEEDSDDEEDEDDEEQASVKTSKTGCTGGEASADTEDDDEDDEDDDSDEDDDDDEEEEDSNKEQKCSVCGKSPCACKKGNSLRESAIRYSRDNFTGSILTEEEMVLCEDIRNNSASKYLSKLAKRAEKEAAKYSKKGMSNEAATSKKVAASFKEASNKLFKCETRYKNGDASAKREYKSICKQYSKELKTLGKTARGLKGLIFTLVSGAILLGAVGTTVIANEADGGIISKISDAISNFKSGNTERGLKVLSDVAENDKKWISSVVNGTNFKATDYAGKKADWAAQDKGWADAAEQHKYTEEGLGGAIKKTKQAAKDFGSGFSKYYKGANEAIGKTLKGAKESAKN